MERGPWAAGLPGGLVVLAETEGIARSGRDVLPHHCKQIPGSVRAEYGAGITAAMAAAAGHPDGELAPIPTTER